MKDMNYCKQIENHYFLRCFLLQGSSDFELCSFIRITLVQRQLRVFVNALKIVQKLVHSFFFIK